MPAQTKEQVSGGVRFQAVGRDNRDVSVLHHNGAPVHGRYVVLRENMHKRLRHYETHDDDGYEMLFTRYLSLDLYYVLTNPNKDAGSTNCLNYLMFLSPSDKKYSLMFGINSVWVLISVHLISE